MNPRTLLQALGLLALPSILCAAPYTGWQNDYTGAEAGTLLLWKFDQPTPNTDSSGNGRNATLGANATSGVAEGKFGQAYYSAIRSTSNDSFAQTGTAAFSTESLSVEFWFKPVSNSLESGYFFDKKYTTTNHTGVSLMLSNANSISDTLLFSVGNGKDTETLRTGTLTWDATLWYHIAVTYENVDGDGYLKIFRNGEVVASTMVEGYGSLVNSGNVWRLGNRVGSGYSSIPGTFDNFRISDIAYEYSTIPEPSAALLILPVLGAGIFLKHNRKR